MIWVKFMENNSIIKGLDKNSLINEIRLLLGNPQSRNKTFVVVEGIDDVLLMKKFLNDNAYLLTSNDGCNTVECIVNRNFGDKDNVIGIRDKDYLIKPSSHKIFFYDYNSLEIMLEANAEVFSAIYNENYHGQLSEKDLFETIFRKLKVISIVRRLNSEQKLGISFDVLKSTYKTLLDIEEYDEWYSSLYEKLRIANDKCMNKNLKELVDRNIEADWNKKDYLNETNGHDFNHLLYAFCVSNYPKAKLSATEIEKSARICFSIKHFKKTDLYKNLRKNRCRKYKAFLIR